MTMTGGFFFKQLGYSDNAIGSILLWTSPKPSSMQMEHFSMSAKSRVLYLSCLFETCAVSYGTIANANNVQTPQCQTLFAGKNIPAGSVCVTNSDTELLVSYTTIGDWYLDDVHLFVGSSLSLVPATKTGNPKIGHFPYIVEDVDLQQYDFSLPLGDFGASLPCAAAKFLAIAAHAALVRSDNYGNTYQTETAWAEGQLLTTKGSRATSFSYTTRCPPDSSSYSCETAFGLGDTSFVDLGITNNRWGWQLTVRNPSNGSVPLYAGAALNDITKGTHVGDVFYSSNGSTLDITYVTSGSWRLKTTHIFANDTSTTKVAPGQFGNTHDKLGYVTTDIYSISVAGNPLYVVAHADVCTAR